MPPDRQRLLSEQVRDFLHVEDVASALAALGQRHLDGVFNIGSGQPITVAEVATTLGRLCGRESLVRLGARPYAPGDPMYVCADTGNIGVPVGTHIETPLRIATGDPFADQRGFTKAGGG